VKILVTTDDESASAEVYALPDPDAPDDAEPDEVEPVFAAKCRAEGCRWDSFVIDGALLVYEMDAVREADLHLFTKHTEKVS
jgi:hypothetical protein